MSLISKSVCVSLVAALCTGCSGMRKTNDTFTAHAESFRVLGYTIPGDDQAAAMKRVPAGAKITNVSSTPADWTSVTGFFGNLFWFGFTEISGTVNGASGKAE